MNDLSSVPTYAPETSKEKFERGIVNVWPKIYRFVNGLFYFLLRTTKNLVIGALQQIFR